MNYIEKVLLLPSDNDKYWQPLDDAVLLVIWDLVKGKISIKEASKVGMSLGKLDYFTNNLYSVDPELWHILDLLAVLGDLSIIRTNENEREKLKKIHHGLRKYLKDRMKRVDEILGIVNQKYSHEEIDKGIIKFETKYDVNLENKILKCLFENMGELTMLEISRLLGNEYKEGSLGWDELKLHLWNMEKEGLLEERHFGKDAAEYDRVVDYSLEPKGMEKARQITSST
jgi:hypothetical protein